MKLDGAIFAIEQRSVGGCIDLAVVFLREHFLGVIQLLAWFAIPSAVLTWWLVDRYEWTTSGCLILFLLECPFFGATLVAAAGHRVFGDRFSPWNGFRLMAGRLLFFSSLMVFIRFITFCAAFFFLIPAYLVATRYGFLAEVLFLEGCPAKRYETRLSDLMNGTFAGLLGRLLALTSFFTMIVLSLFVLVDMTSSTLFGLPIMAGRITDLAYLDEELVTLFFYDPRVATVLVFVMWLAYPVTRLAWMFCYLDDRIRKEGWDVELAFRVEARRLEAGL